MRISLPLLAKDLAELAARRRTYAVRALWAAGVFAVFGASRALADAANGPDPLALLGRGDALLFNLVLIEFSAVALFVPGMTAAAIAAERERGTLELLLLTDLGPFSILLQKLLARLVPVGTLLLASLPVFAVAYSLGGVSPNDLATAVWTLLLGASQVASLSIAVSALCRSTVGAVLLSYGALAALWLGIPAFEGPLGLRTARIVGFPAECLVTPPFVYLVAQFRLFGDSPEPFWKVLFVSLPSLASCAVFLLLARWFLVRAPASRPRNWIREGLRRLDRLATRANRAAGGIVLVRGTASLPGDEPVAWREMSRRALGNPRNVVRIAVLLTLPAFVLVATLVLSPPRGRMDRIPAALGLLWAVLLVSIPALAAGAFAGERSRGTLDLLLATPLSGREIVRQKMRGVFRWISMLLVPYAALVVAGALWKGIERVPPWTEWLGTRAASGLAGLGLDVATAFAAYLVYPRFFAWFSAWVDLRARTPARGILGALGALVLWLGGPFLIPVFFESVLREPARAQIALATNPAALILLGTDPLWDSALSWWSIRSRVPFVVFAAANLALHAALAAAFRRRCLSRADRYLGRFG